MKTTQQLAKHFRDVHFGGNWTFVNLKDTLADISWQEATAKHLDFNTIANLLFHINYYDFDMMTPHSKISTRVTTWVSMG